MDALPHFQRRSRSIPNFALAYVKMAVGAGNIGRSNERDAYAKRALDARRSPDAARALLHRGLLLLQQRLRRSARRSRPTRRCVELYPDHSASRNNLAVLLPRTDQFDKARRALRHPARARLRVPGRRRQPRRRLRRAWTSRTRRCRSCDEFVDRFPDVESGYMSISASPSSAADRIWTKREAAFEKALALRPGLSTGGRGTGADRDAARRLRAYAAS